jgi:hypothetical protein
MMGMNFPNAPTEGQTFVVSPKLVYMYKNGLWQNITGNQTALPFNHVINGAMQISQENGSTSLATSGLFCADQWQGAFPQPNGSMAQVIGTPNAIRLWCGTVIASPAAGQSAYFQQPIEGRRFAEAQWGTAGARQVVLRFKAGITGGAVPHTFSVALRTYTTPFLAYVHNFTITVASLLQEFSVAIPGPTTGTWAIDTNYAASVFFTGMSGSTLTAPAADVWTAANYIAAPGITNLFNTANRGLDIADVGLYLDPFLTGIAPPWEAPDYAQSLWECQRYLEYMGVTAGATIPPWPWYNWQFKAEKRITAPAFAIVQGAANGATYAPTIGGNLAFRQASPASGAVDHRIVCNAR